MAKAKMKAASNKKTVAAKKPVDMSQQLRAAEEKAYQAALQKILNFVHKFEEKKEKIVAKAVMKFENQAAKDFAKLLDSTAPKKAKKKKTAKKKTAKPVAATQVKPTVSKTKATAKAKQAKAKKAPAKTTTPVAAHTEANTVNKAA